jgi:hypothetical protein
MKVRAGFVSNSSSSSFIIPDYYTFEKEFEKCFHYYNNKNQKEKIKEKVKEWYGKYFDDDEFFEMYEEALKIIKSYKKYSKKISIEEIENKKYFTIYDLEHLDYAFHRYIAIKYIDFKYDILKIIHELNISDIKSFYKIFNNSLFCKLKKITTKQRNSFYLNLIDYKKYIFKRLKEEFPKIKKYQLKKIDNIIENSFKRLYRYYRQWAKTEQKKLNKYENFYILEISDGGGSGIYNYLIEKEFIKIPSIYIENNH